MPGHVELVTVGAVIYQTVAYTSVHIAVRGNGIRQVIQVRSEKAAKNKVCQVARDCAVGLSRTTPDWWEFNLCLLWPIFLGDLCRGYVAEDEASGAMKIAVKTITAKEYDGCKALLNAAFHTLLERRNSVAHSFLWCAYFTRNSR